MVPALVREPVLPGKMSTPTPLVPIELEIVPLFETVLLELMVTAAPAALISTEPLFVIVILPGVLFAAAPVVTGVLVDLSIVRSSARAGATITAPIAPSKST